MTDFLGLFCVAALFDFEKSRFFTLIVSFLERIKFCCNLARLVLLMKLFVSFASERQLLLLLYTFSLLFELAIVSYALEDIV